MPELPEVQSVVDTIRPHAVGRRIEGVEVLREDIVSPDAQVFRAGLAGRLVGDVSRRAKRIIFRLDDGNRFYIHLGMSGRLLFCEPAEPMRKHTHLVIHLPGGQIRFTDPRRFGGVFWTGNESNDEADLGPEPLTLRPAKLIERLSKTRRAVKNALLDQRLIAGLGNIYVDESLHKAGIHPLTIAADLSAARVTELNRAIKAVLRRAVRHKGSTLRDYTDANGETGGFQLLHAVYAREDKPCRRCKTKIQRIVLGGRSTHFCPKCQMK